MAKSVDPKLAELIEALAREAALEDHERDLAERRERVAAAKRLASSQIVKTPVPDNRS